MADANGIELSSPACFAGECHFKGNGDAVSDIKDIRIAVIGCGMGGLGTALSLAKKGFKNIDLFETASNLGFVGAGIQMAPNMLRILDRLGCWEGLEKDSTKVLGSSIRQGSTNEELTHVPMPNIKELYGYNHCTAHRHSLAGGMYEACKKEEAIKFHFATSLIAITDFYPRPAITVQPRGSQPYTVRADLVLACDGIKSITRPAVLSTIGAQEDEEETGQAAYRIMLNRADMESDPDLLSLIDSDVVIRWIGEKRHIIAYPVAGRTIYNLSTTQPDKNFAAAPSATYTTRGSKSVLLDVFSDFCPLVQKMLHLVPDGQVCEWRLRMHKALPTWTAGCIALLGDACHPTLPHLSQGAAMAIEDGAVVAEALSLAPDAQPATLARILKVYEMSRRDWTTQLVKLAFFSGRTLHLGEGKAKEERDRQFAEAKAKGEGVVPDKWASPEVQKMIYSNDCVANLRADFDALWKRAVEEISEDQLAETKVRGASEEGCDVKRKREVTPLTEEKSVPDVPMESPKKVRTDPLQNGGSVSDIGKE